MKGFKVIFAVCLATLGFHVAYADDAADIVRAAVRRTQNTSQNSSAQTSARSKATPSPQSNASSDTKSAPTVSQSTISRVTNAVSKSGVVIRERPNSAVTASRGGGAAATSDSGRGQNVVSRSAPATSANPQTRQNASIAARPGTTHTGVSATTGASRTTASRAATLNPARTTSSDSIAPRTTSARTATSQKSPGRARSATQSRAATDISERPNLGNQKKCREVYYSCMDEFCANKDAQLKRCACSSRIREFNKIKNNLSTIEDKMLTFNQRLLTVNMDKEDAAALYQATEGEKAYSQADISESKRTLDEIAKKLNTSFDDSKFDRGLTAISLSLNTESAFDNLDANQGASATAKSGTALYNAALPICREMAQEVCTPDELTIAEGGYQATIEQDCNTVYKSYQAQTDQARNKIREGSALLDMSRLDVYQKRNSDDILTCKSKMLEKLTDTTVCGADMGKCLDVSGRYIDPTTGQAFLTESLVNLTTLITRPADNETWSTRPSNGTFVTFLNSKKKYLEPAMENCQDIADQVWKSFLDDALSQIKIAQDKKLEEVRQSCTTLNTQCLSDTAKTLAEFDARALSTFGVQADKTVNAMCASVRRACTALLQDSSDAGATEWAAGMTEIANTKTYETIVQTCREVGRACIIQACTSISGNFGLCEDINNSINRKSILNRSACWNEVYNCVASAGGDQINAIIDQMYNTISTQDKTKNPFYDYIYNYAIYERTTTKSTEINKYDDRLYIEDICTEYTDETKYRTCRIAESIWGNCNAPANTDYDINRIITTDNGNKNVDTLLAWFARNTGTENAPDSCRDLSCPSGHKSATVFNSDQTTCTSPDNVTTCNFACTSANPIIKAIKDGDNVTYSFCCPGKVDSFGNCVVTDGNQELAEAEIKNITFNSNYTIPENGIKIYASSASNNINPIAIYDDNDVKTLLVCVGDVQTITDTTEPGLHCNGHFVSVKLDGDTPGIYYQKSAPQQITNFIDTKCRDDDKTSRYNYNGTNWCTEGTTNCTDIQHWTIEYRF